MSWFRVQLFCLTGNSPHTSNVTSLNLSFLICEMGPVLPVQLVVRLRDNQCCGPAQCLVHRSYPPGAEKSCLHVYKWWSRTRRVLHKRCKQSLRNPTRREINPGWFHGRVCLGWAWKDGQDINRLWEEGQFQMEKKKNCEKRGTQTPCLSPKYSILLPGPHIWPSLTITAVFSTVFVVVQLILLNCDAGEDSWESLGLPQGDQTSQCERKSTLNIHWKNWCWS